MSRKFLSGLFCLALLISLACAAALASSADPDAGEGKKLFAQHCSSCHYADRTETKVGPGLKGLFTRAKLKTGAAVNEDNVRQLIENGHDGMPPFKNVLTTAQIDDLIAYLKTT